MIWNNLIEILDSLKKEGVLSLRASRKGGVAISVHKPLGLWTALAKPISVRKPKVCEPCWWKPISLFI